MNKILLVDVDSTIPNIALMKLSSWYKQQQHSHVDFLKLNIPIYKSKTYRVDVDLAEYDVVYVSTIFKGTLQHITFKNTDGVLLDIGGTGSDDITKKLPTEIENCPPDYSIYPDSDTSYDFFSRGCIRDCEFCLVRKKEGVLHQVSTLSEILARSPHKKIKFLDNNFLALPNHLEILQELITLKVKCQFNQGLDIRLISDANVSLISKLNYIGEYIFAFDNLNLKPIVEEKLKILKKYIPKDWKLKFFIYCHPDMDIVNDVYYRILWCKENGVLPYFMRHQDCWESENRTTYNDFSAWCNQPGIFKTHTYEQFCVKRRSSRKIPDCYPKWLQNIREGI